MNRQLDDHFVLRRARLSTGELNFSKKTGSEREIEAFVAVTSTCRVPVEVLHVRSGDADSLPISALGKTSVKYVGATPMISVEPDANGNLEMLFTGTGAVEILYNSKKMGSRGMNGR